VAISFFAELRRRNVVKVGITYVVAAWLLIQAVTTVLPTFNAPAWVVPSITFLLILAFPFVLVFAWAFEITPDGLKKTRDVAPEASITSQTSQRLNYVIVALLVVAVGLASVEIVRGGSAASRAPAAANGASAAQPAGANDSPSSPARAANGSQPLPNSVAVIPLANLSPRQEDAYFAAGIHDEILNQLVKLKNLSVIARTSVMQYAGTTKTSQEIGHELGVKNILEGSVRYADGRVLVTAELIDAATNVSLWSESYERELSNIFAIQADIAMNVANAMRAEFTPAEQQSVERPPTTSLPAYEQYLIATARSARLTGQGGPGSALEAVDAALAIDPNFVKALILKANILAFLAQTAKGAAFESDTEQAVTAALRAAELEPGTPQTQALLVNVHSRRGEWALAEDALRSTDGASAAAGLTYLHSFAVGRLERARDASALARQTDPFNQTGRAFYMLGFAMLGDFDRAEQEYTRGTEAFGNPWYLGTWFLTMERARPGRVLTAADVPPGIGKASAQNSIPQYLQSPQAGLAWLRDFAKDQSLGTDQLSVIALWSAYFGGPDLSLDSIERATRRNAQNAFLLWLPAMHDVRQLPAFKTFVTEIGLVDDWRKYGWPTLCKPVGANDFACS
jgi:TolB-like protein